MRLSLADEIKERLGRNTKQNQNFFATSRASIQDDRQGEVSYIPYVFGTVMFLWIALIDYLVTVWVKVDLDIDNGKRHRTEAVQ